MKLGFILWLAVSAVIFVSAATASRLYVSTSNMLWVLLSMTLYIVGNLIMIRLMREGGLGLAISISAIAQLVLANVIAFGFFDEKLSPIQMGGIMLGLVAVSLMMWPSNGSV
jgi:multidrug transporter EmrE-like cation transporter